MSEPDRNTRQRSAYDDTAHDDTLLGKDTRIKAPVPPPAGTIARLTFRSWTERDLPQYQAMLAPPELWRYMHEDYPGDMTADLARTLIDLSAQAAHHKVRAAELDGVVIGQARMQWHPRTTPPQSGEVSYWLAREHWGRGLAAPMVACFLWRCLGMFPALTRITARVHRDNPASQRVLGRLGFRVLPESAADDWQTYALSRRDGIDLSRAALLRPPG